MMFNSFFNDYFMDDFFADRTAKNNMMATDISETENGYELSIELPGVGKDGIQAKLKDGYLTITVQTASDAKKENSRYIRRERRSGTYTRSFYVGDSITQEDISAKLADGVLTLFVPKQTAHPEMEDKHLIAIEG